MRTGAEGVTWVKCTDLRFLLKQSESVKEQRRSEGHCQLILQGEGHREISLSVEEIETITRTLGWLVDLLVVRILALVPLRLKDGLLERLDTLEHSRFRSTYLLLFQFLAAKVGFVENGAFKASLISVVISRKATQSIQVLIEPKVSRGKRYSLVMRSKDNIQNRMTDLLASLEFCDGKSGWTPRNG